jgi:hypothetical protein
VAQWREVVVILVRLAFHPASTWGTAEMLLERARHLLEDFSNSACDEEFQPRPVDAPESSHTIINECKSAPGGLHIAWEPLLDAWMTMLDPVAPSAYASASVAKPYAAALGHFMRACRPWFRFQRAGEAIYDALKSDMRRADARADEALAMFVSFAPPLETDATRMGEWSGLWSLRPPCSSADGLWADVFHQTLEHSRMAALGGSAKELERHIAFREALSGTLVPLVLARLQWALQLRVAGRSDNLSRLGGMGEAILSHVGLAGGRSSRHPATALMELLVELMGSAPRGSDAHTLLADDWTDAADRETLPSGDIDLSWKEEAQIDALASDASLDAAVVGLARLTRVCLQFAHPSNVGHWTEALSQAFTALVRAVAVRFDKDTAWASPEAFIGTAAPLLLSKAAIDAVVNVTLPLARRFAYSRDVRAAFRATSSIFPLIATLRPEQCSSAVCLILEDALYSSSAEVSKFKALAATALLASTAAPLSWPRPVILPKLEAFLPAIPPLIVAAEPMRCVLATALVTELANILRFSPAEDGPTAFPDRGWLADGSPTSSKPFMDGWALSTVPEATSLARCTHPVLGESVSAASLRDLFDQVDAPSTDSREALATWSRDVLLQCRAVVEGSEASAGRGHGVDRVLYSGLRMGVPSGAWMSGAIGLPESAAAAVHSLLQALPPPEAMEEAAKIVDWALRMAPTEATNAVSGFVQSALLVHPELRSRVMDTVLPKVFSMLTMAPRAEGDASILSSHDLVAMPASVSARAASLLRWHLELLVGASWLSGEALLPHCGVLALVAVNAVRADCESTAVRDQGLALMAVVLQSLCWTRPVPTHAGARWKPLKPTYALVGATAPLAGHWWTPTADTLAAAHSILQFALGRSLSQACTLVADESIVSPSPALVKTVMNSFQLAGVCIRGAAPILADHAEEHGNIVRTGAKASLATVVLGVDAARALFDACTSLGAPPLQHSGSPHAGVETVSARQLVASTCASLLGVLANHTYDMADSTSQKWFRQHRCVHELLMLTFDVTTARGRKYSSAVSIAQHARSIGTLAELDTARTHRRYKGPHGSPWILDPSAVLHVPFGADAAREAAFAEREGQQIRSSIRALRDTAAAEQDADGEVDVPWPAHEGSGKPVAEHRGATFPSSWIHASHRPGHGAGPLERPYRASVAHVITLAGFGTDDIAASSSSILPALLSYVLSWLRPQVAKAAARALEHAADGSPTDASDEERQFRFHVTRAAAAVLNLTVCGHRAASLWHVRTRLARLVAGGKLRSLVSNPPAGKSDQALGYLALILGSFFHHSEARALPHAHDSVHVLETRPEIVDTLALCVAMPPTHRALPETEARTWADRVFSIALLSSILPMGMDSPSSGSVRLGPPSSSVTRSEAEALAGAALSAAVDTRAALPVRGAAITAAANAMFVAAGAGVWHASCDKALLGAPGWGESLRVSAAELLTKGRWTPRLTSGEELPTITLDALVRALRENHEEATAAADGLPGASGERRGKRSASALWSPGVKEAVESVQLVYGAVPFHGSHRSGNALLVESTIDAAVAAAARGETSRSKPTQMLVDASAAWLEAARRLMEQVKSASSMDGSDSALGAEERRSTAMAAAEIWAAVTRTLLRRLDCSPPEPGWFPTASTEEDAVRSFLGEGHPLGLSLSAALSDVARALTFWPSGWIREDWADAMRYCRHNIPLEQQVLLLGWLACHLQAEGEEASVRASKRLKGEASDETSLTRAHRWLTVAAHAWGKALRGSMRLGLDLEQSSLHPTSLGQVSLRPYSLDSHPRRFDTAQWLHDTATTKLLPATALLSSHLAASVREVAGGFLGVIATLAVSPDSVVPFRPGSALPAVVSAVESLFPASDSEAEALTSLPVGDSKALLHNGRVLSVSFAIKTAMYTGHAPARTAALLCLLPRLLHRGRPASGDEDTFKEVMGCISMLHNVRSSPTDAHDRSLIVWACEQANAVNGTDVVHSHIDDLWGKAALTSPSAAMLAQAICGMLESPHWRVKAGTLIEVVGLSAHHQFSWPSACLDAVQREVRRRMTDERKEVRTTSQAAWMGLLPLMPAAAREAVASSWVKVAKRPLPAADSPKYETALRQKHGLALGVGAVLNAFPYSLPHWLPVLVVTFADVVSFPSPVKDAVRAAWADFRHTHSDTWQEHKLRFTRDQLDMLGSLGATTTMFA